MGEGKTERFCITDGKLNVTSAVGSVVNSAGAQIPVVDHYKYLGVNVMAWPAEWAAKKKKVWAAARSLRGVWKSRISREAKMALLRAVCEPILRYGNGSLLRTRSQYDAVDWLWGRLLRYAFDLQPAFVSRAIVGTAELYGEENFMSAVLRSSRAAFVAHALRETAELRADHPMAWVLAFEPSSHKWPRLSGGQRRTIQEMLLRDCHCGDMHDFGAIACDRQRCNRMVKRVLRALLRALLRCVRATLLSCSSGLRGRLVLLDAYSRLACQSASLQRRCRKSLVPSNRPFSVA